MTEQPAPRVAVLRGFPVRIWARQREYYDGLLREFNLMLLGEQAGASSAPARLIELADDLTRRFGPMLDAVQEERETALARGELTVDSTVPLVDGVLEVLAWVKGVFTEVDAFCERGDMLTLAMPRELKALRDWTTDELAHQIAGGTPRPWTGPLQ